MFDRTNRREVACQVCLVLQVRGEAATEGERMGFCFGSQGAVAGTGAEGRRHVRLAGQRQVTGLLRGSGRCRRAGLWSRRTQLCGCVWTTARAMEEVGHLVEQGGGVHRQLCTVYSHTHGAHNEYMEQWVWTVGS